MKTIAINGSNGFIGKALCNYFANKYFIIKILRHEYLINPIFLASKIETADIIINIAGASISNKWTKKYKKLILSSRLDTTQNLIKAIAICKKKPELFLCTSAIGIYDSYNEHSDDSINYGSGFLVSVCKNIESIVSKLDEIYVENTILRLGVVIGNEGGAFPIMVKPFRFGLGAILGNGNQMMSFIHIHDFVRAVEFIIDNKITGKVNIVSPEYCSNSQFSKEIACLLKKPILFKIPKLILKFFLGELQEVITDSKRVKPEVLLKYGFNFNFKNYKEALINLIQKR